MQMSDNSSKIGVARIADIKMPFKKYKTDAGYDVAVNENVTLMPNELKVIGTGLYFVSYENKNIFGMIRSRSSMFMKGIMCEGIIDNDYRGEIKLMIKNMNDNIASIEKGVRVAQIIFLNYNNIDFFDTESIEHTDREGGGFGSTGLL